MPKRRGSLKTTRAPEERSKTTWSWARERAARMIVVAGDVLAGLGLDPERAGHAEMHDEDVAVVEVGEEVFRPAAERDDPAAGEAMRRSAAGTASGGPAGGASPGRSPRPPSPGRARGGRFRLRAVRAWRLALTLCEAGDDSLSRRLGLSSAPTGEPDMSERAGNQGDRRARGARLLRIPRGRPRREAGPGRRRLRARGAALRPDERPDVGRHAPGLEGRAGVAARPAAPAAPAPTGCSTSPAAPATSPSASPAARRGRDGHRRRHQRRDAGGRPRAGRGAPPRPRRHASSRPMPRRCRSTERSFRCRNDRLRHPQRAADRRWRWPRPTAC